MESPVAEGHGVGFSADGARVPDRARPRRPHADRPARPDWPRRRPRAARQARVPEPGWLEQGPDRGGDGRSRRAGRAAAAGRHDRRADLRQHRRRPRDRRRREGLPLHLRDARQDEPGEDLDAPSLWRGGDHHPDCGRARLARELLLRLVAPRRGDSRRLQARPVLEHVQSRGALPDHGPGDLGADWRRARRDRDLRRHRRHDLGRRPLLQGAQAGGADRRRRPRGLRLHGRRGAPAAPVPRRGDRQGHVAARRWIPTSSTSGFVSPTATRS